MIAVASSPLASLAQLLSAKPKPQQPRDFWHSDDYTEIRIGTIVYLQTKMQAAAIRVIHEAHLNGRIDVPGDRILKQIGSECTRMGELFRYSSAWTTVVVSPFRRGFYSLSPFVTIK